MVSWPSLFKRGKFPRLRETASTSVFSNFQKSILWQNLLKYYSLLSLYPPCLKQQQYLLALGSWEHRRQEQPEICGPLNLGKHTPRKGLPRLSVQGRGWGWQKRHRWWRQGKNVSGGRKAGRCQQGRLLPPKKSLQTKPRGDFRGATEDWRVKVSISGRACYSLPFSCYFYFRRPITSLKISVTRIHHRVKNTSS